MESRLTAAIIPLKKPSGFQKKPDNLIYLLHAEVTFTEKRNQWLSWAIAAYRILLKF